MVRELFWSLFHHLVLAVGIVPDEVPAINADVLPRHILEDLLSQVHIGRVSNKHQTNSDRCRARSPGTHLRAFGKYFLNTNVGTRPIGLAHEPTGHAERVTHDV